MSTDVHSNVPENGRPHDSDSGSDTSAGAGDGDETTAVPASAAPTNEPAPDADPAPARPDETHVAIPSQREESGFDEVDGGEPSEPATSADDTRTAAFVPTAEEDAALRDERARRFGRPRAEADPAPAETGGTEPGTTSVAPLAAAGAVAGSSRVAGTTSTQTMPVTPAPSTGTDGDDDPFSEFDDGPTSRAAAHWWSILVSIVFVPVAWYLLTDGGERTAFNLTGGGPFNLAAPLELAGGALCLFFVLLAARWSSIGVILTGTISALLGIAFLAVNSEAMSLIGQYQGTLVQALNQLGQNIVDHMLADAQSGRLAVYGIVLIMVGVVSHGARRQGRREEKRRAVLGV